MFVRETQGGAQWHSLKKDKLQQLEIDHRIREITEKKVYKTLKDHQYSSSNKNIPPIMQQKFMKVVELLTAWGISTIGQVFIIQALSQATPDQIKSAVEATKSFTCGKNLSNHERTQILQAFCRPASTEVEPILEAIKLLTNRMNTYNKMNVLEALTQGTSNHVGLIVKAVQLLITEHTHNEHDKVQIIKILTELPQDRIESIVDALQLLKIKFFLDEFIQALDQLASDQIEPITKTAQSLITEEMDEYSKLQIIRALVRLTSDQVHVAKLFITEETNAYEKIQILQACGRFTAEQIESAIKAAELLSNEEISITNKICIIESLRSIASNQIEPFIENIKSFITNKDYYERIDNYVYSLCKSRAFS